jgi:hypothetical protein
MFHRQKSPSQSIRIESQVKKRRPVGYGKYMEKRSPFTNRMVKSDFGNMVSDPSPVDNPRIGLPREMIGKKIY